MEYVKLLCAKSCFSLCFPPFRCLMMDYFILGEILRGKVVPAMLNPLNDKNINSLPCS